MSQILIDDRLSLISQSPEAVGGFVAAIEATKDPATGQGRRFGFVFLCCEAQAQHHY